jgi:hypothetical protein
MRYLRVGTSRGTCARTTRLWLTQTRRHAWRPAAHKTDEALGDRTVKTRILIPALSFILLAHTVAFPHLAPSAWAFGPLAFPSQPQSAKSTLLSAQDTGASGAGGAASNSATAASAPAAATAVSLNLSGGSDTPTVAGAAAGTPSAGPSGTPADAPEPEKKTETPPWIDKFAGSSIFTQVSSNFDTFFPAFSPNRPRLSYPRRFVRGLRSPKTGSCVARWRSLTR